MRIARSTSELFVVSLAFCFLLPVGTRAQAPVPSFSAPQASPAPQSDVTILSDQQKDEFRNKMLSNPPPGGGCFEAQPNNPTWKSVPCQPAPKAPSPLARGKNIVKFTVGNATDDVAQVAGTISSVTGSFENATGITQIYSPVYQDNSKTVHPNTYTLQINANRFSTNATSACAHVAGCSGWEQFIFSQRSGCGGTACVYIEYWLMDSPSCPSNGAAHKGCSCPGNPWIAYYDTSGVTASGCFFNTPSTGTPTPSVADLGRIKFLGQANVGGFDVAALQTADGVLHANRYAASTLNLAAGWTGAEFNVFGDCCAYGAFFNAGSNMTVRINTTSTKAPTCFLSTPTTFFTGSTAETNNLTLVNNSCAAKSPSDITFAQSGGGDPRALGYSIGDPHLATLNGVHYDFQAVGDFLVLDAGPEFIVQARHKALNASVSVNTAVAAKMGNTTVAVCLPGQLEVNGKPTTLSDGQAIAFGSVLLSRQGNVYEMIGPAAAKVRAEMTPTYINLYVFPGAINREATRGPLGGSVLAMRNGPPLANPPAYKDFVAFSRSWQVKPTESLLCKGPTVAFQAPAVPISADDLSPGDRDRLQSVCSNAGIRDRTLLNDCMLDVSVLGDQKSVIEPFLSVPPPSIHIKPTYP